MKSKLETKTGCNQSKEARRETKKMKRTRARDKERGDSEENQKVSQEDDHKAGS